MKQLTALLFTTLCLTGVCKSQDLPNDLISVSNVTVYATWYSIASWPAVPPCPINCWGDGSPLYYSPSWDAIFVDDREYVANRMFTQNDSGLLPPGDY